MQTKTKLSEKDILALFQNGCKTDCKVGIEYERLPIFSANNKAADYGADNGICNFLRNFAKEENWDYITDDYNIIGLKQEHDTITLEPGCQVELSLKPENTIFDVRNKVNSLDKKLKPVLDKFGIKLLNYGVSPLFGEFYPT